MKEFLHKICISMYEWISLKHNSIYIRCEGRVFDILLWLTIFK